MAKREPKDGYRGMPEPEPEALYATLARVRSPLASEREDQHAALLLWAMMQNEKRSWSALSRATGSDAKTLREWYTKWCWGPRLGRHGRKDTAAPERDAATLYKEVYLDITGREPVDVLQKYMRPSVWAIVAFGGEGDHPGGFRRVKDSEDLPAVVPGPSDEESVGSTYVEAPVGVAGGGPESGTAVTENSYAETGGETPASVQPKSGVFDGGFEALKRGPRGGPEAVVAKARLEAAKTEAAQLAHLEKVRAAQEAREKERERMEQMFRGSMRLLEKYVADLAKQVNEVDADGRQTGVRPRPSDLPKFLELYRELGEATGAIAPQVTANGGSLEPSYRVQLAQSTGGDVLEAMLADVEECRMILSVLRDTQRANTLGAPDPEE